MKPKLVRITTVPVSLDKLLSRQMNFMNNAGFDVYMISSDCDYKSELEAKERSKFIVVNMARKISLIRDLFSLFQMIMVLRRLEPDIVHTHTPKAGLIGMLASWITRVPIRIHTVAGLPLMETHGIKRRILDLMEKLTYALATKVYPNSLRLKEFIIKEKFTSESKTKVIGFGSSNGIDTDFFSPNIVIEEEANRISNKFGLSDANFTYVFIGRVVKDKGIEELVDAFLQLSLTRTNCRLFIVGALEQNLNPISDASLKKIQDSSSIITVGRVDDVRPYLQLADALVFPSYREGFPNVPMQAGCFNLPSIVSDINGCNEIISHYRNGLIVPPKEVEPLRKAMELLLTDKVLYESLKSASRNMIVDRYEQKKMWDLILLEYKCLLSK